MAVLSSSDRKSLESNPNILKVTDKNVTYTTAFKKKAILLADQGKSYDQIFMDAGIDVTLFGRQYTRKCINRWREISSKGDLAKETRGTKATGRPRGKKFKSLVEENAYLRAEVDFLKKLQALEAQHAKKKSSR